MPTTIARVFEHELDLATREPIAGLMELLLAKSAAGLVSAEGQPFDLLRSSAQRGAIIAY